MTKPSRKLPKGLYLRGKTYWYAKQVDRKRHFVSLETSDLAVAIAARQKLMDEAPLESGTILKFAVERYIAYSVARGDWKMSTERSKGYVLKKFAEWAGSVTPASVTVATIRAYYDERRKTKSPPTAHGNVMTLRGFFRWCQEVERSCRTNPAAELKIKAPTPSARLNFCNAELRNKLIAECPRADLKFVLFCGFHAGMRFAEIVEAKASWFDLATGTLHLRKHEGIDFKDGEERSLPLTAAFKAFLQDEYGLHDPYMLHPEIPFRRKSIYRYDFGAGFKAYMEAQKVPWVTPHIMRHTFASLLASAGVSIFKIAKWLGDDVRVAQRHYAKLLPNDADIERAF